MLVHLFRVGIRGGPFPGWSLQSLRFQTFSATRSSDDRFRSRLLRAVAQLRSQLRAHLPQVPPASQRSPSAWCWLGGTLVVPALLWQHPRLCLVALCEAEASAPAHPTPSAQELRFNWKLFWHFLHPHLLALGAAIVLALVFSSLLRQDIAFFDAKKTGQLVSRLTTDVQEFKSSFKLVISQGLRSCTQVVGSLVSLSLLSPRLTLLLAIVTPALMGVGTLMGSGLRKLSRQCQEQIAKATGLADEALGNVRTVRAFAMEQREAECYEAELEACRCKAEELGRGIALFQGLSNIAFNCMVLGTLFVGGSLVAGQQLKGGDLMSFLVASQTVQRSIASLSVLFGQVVRGLSAGARAFEYMTLSPNIPLTGGCCIPNKDLHGSITFHNVSFSYPCRPGFEVLKDFTLTLPPGKIVALVGQSGGGKSTVASLLERFYDPTAGVVTLDGYDLRTLNPSWLRGQVIGFISQEPVLFGTTIMENIRFGKLEASDEEVYRAAREANAHEFISSFPDGYSTVVGERGATLSGGQKQRLAIARALIKQPTVLILDEATSALDAESERVVQEALDRASAGRTVLVIAHRLSTVHAAHRIVVMANGQVCEAGTHEELLKKGGLYAELIRRQALDAPVTSAPPAKKSEDPRNHQGKA
ncbi:ATP-binding cassette sub-family B member 8, mitochondrial isoform X1 [Sigmodon hispidus]